MKSILIALMFMPVSNIDHSAWDALLAKHVKDGRVDYTAFKADRAKLAVYLKSLENARAETVADPINAYNALVVAALLDQPNLPKQVTDIKGFFDAKKYKVLGAEQTLNELEGVARKTSKDARIHFAFNCGARSCPPLPSKAFDGATIDATLTKLTSAFLDKYGVEIDEKKKSIRVTKLMEWYKDDFVQSAGSIEKFLEKYLSDPAKKKAVASGSYTITFQEYDWTPNQSG